MHIGFDEQAVAGTDRHALAAYAAENGGENEFDGIEFGYRHDTSPVIVHEAADPPPWSERDYVPSTWPGARPPSFILEDRTALFDHFGAGMTLVDFRGDAARLIEQATARGVPIVYVSIEEPRVRRAWQRNLVLVRADQCVAWRGDAVPDPASWDRIFDVVTGRSPASA